MGRRLPARVAAALFAALAASAFAAPGGLSFASVSYVEFDRISVAEGVVEAVRQSTVAAQLPGRVVALPVKAGDSVRKGELIAQIDPRTASQAEAASRSQVREAQANLANAKARYDRTVRLAEQKFVSAAAVDQARSEFLAAQAQAETATANASQAATSMNLMTIAAPYDAVVGSTEVEVGDMATPGRPLATLFDPGALRVTVTVPQAVLAQARLDAAIRIEIPALERVVTARRATVVPLADSRTHTTRVRLDLPGQTGLMPGQYARAWIPNGRTRALAVPESAIVRRSEVTAVYVLDRSGHAQLRQVRVGASAGEGRVEMLSGSCAGERVALDPVRAGIEASSATMPAS